MKTLCVLFAFLWPAWAEEQSVSVATPSNSYRKLAVERAHFPVSYLHYHISVDKWPESIDDIKPVVCAVVSDEKPRDYEVLVVYFYFNLEKCVTPLVPDIYPEDPLAWKRDIGHYVIRADRAQGMLYLHRDNKIS